MVDEAIRIDGARVILRDLAPDDVAVLEYWLQPDRRWQELDGPLYGQPSPAVVARILDDRRGLVVNGQRPRPRTRLAIAARDGGSMLGEVSWYGVGHVSGETGLNVVIYNPDLWGYGLGYEAFGLWCDYLFGELPEVAQLDLRTWARNAGMIRLAHKLQFVEVRSRRRGRFGLGRRTERVAFVLPRRTWLRSFPDGFAQSLAGEL